MRAITTGGDPIAAAISARPGPTTPSRTSPRSGSSAGLSSAASSMSTSEPHRSAGQGQWPSSGTPQAHSEANYGMAEDPDAGVAAGPVSVGVGVAVGPVSV